MHTLATLFVDKPVVFVHLVSAVGALLLGLVLLLRRKGTAGHRGLGYSWVLLMGTAAVSSAFIRADRLPNIAGFSPIHLFTVAVAVMLPLAIWHARQGRVQLHRKLMRNMYVGGCVVAGLFAFAPGRVLHQMLMGSLGQLA